MYMHDVPKCISPKFADDFVAITIRSDLKNIMSDLQQSIDKLVSWTEEWGMVLNETKTKVMLFGASGGEVVNVMINDQPIEQVTSHKYLGIILDTQLDFSLQAEYAAGKAKRPSAKVSTLYDSREGIPVQTGISLYKTLVRPHMEYAIPVWAAMRAKAHSSIAAIEVITGIVPVRIRI